MPRGIPNNPKSTKKRLEENFIPEPMSGCWLWIGPTIGKTGYGRIGLYEGKFIRVRAHRASWMFYKGPIPRGMSVLHKCDVRPCINPDHLFLGSQKINMQDRTKKQRHLFGEKAIGVKLKEINVIKIREDTRPQRQIAQSYNIDQSTVSDIKRRKHWKHI